MLFKALLLLRKKLPVFSGVSGNVQTVYILVSPDVQLMWLMSTLKIKLVI